MNQKLFSMIFIPMLAVSCVVERGIPFDQSMTVIQEAGYTLTVLNVSEMRCSQGMEKDGASVVFMQVYCGLEDNLDMINFGINPAHSPRGKEKMLEALELIEFPYGDEVIEFFSWNENRLTQGNPVEKTVGSWRLSVSPQPAGAEMIIFIGLQSANFIDASGK